MTGPVDLRLVPAAVSAWGAAIVVVRCTSPAVIGVAVAALAIGAATWFWRDRRWSGTAALVSGVAVAVLVAGTVQHGAREPPEALVSRAVFVEVVVVERPTLLAGERCSWPVTVERVAVLPGRDEDPAAMVLADAAEPPVWPMPDAVAIGPCTEVQVGSRIRADGRVRALPRDRKAAVAIDLDQQSESVAAPQGVWAGAASLRRSGAEACAQLPGPVGRMLPAIVWGDTTSVTAADRDRMVAAGIAHLTAVSGGHVALVLAAVMMVMQTIGLPLALRVVGAALGGAGLAVLVGPEPSVLRALAMGASGLVGTALGRRSAAPAALSTAVVVLLLVDPWLGADIGFAMSVAATAGIVGLGGCLVRRWSADGPVAAVGEPEQWTPGRRLLPRPVAVVLAVPVAAQVAVTPLSVVLQPGLPLLAVPANLVVAPVVGATTLLGLLGLLLSWWPPAGRAVMWGAGAGVAWIMQVGGTVESMPGSVAPWMAGPGGVVAAGVATAGLTGLLCGRGLALLVPWLRCGDGERAGVTRRRRRSSSSRGRRSCSPRGP